MSYRSTHIRIYSIFFRPVQYFMLWTYNSLFSHFPITGCLGCFQSLTITDNAALNNILALSLWGNVQASLGREVELLGHRVQA